MASKSNHAVNAALAVALGISVGAVNRVDAQTSTAKAYVPPMQCPPKQIPTTPERGCIADRSADFEMGKGKHARTLTLPSAGIDTTAPRASTNNVTSTSTTTPK